MPCSGLFARTCVFVLLCLAVSSQNLTQFSSSTIPAQTSTLETPADGANQSTIPASPTTTGVPNNGTSPNVYSLVNSAYDCYLAISRWTSTAKGTWLTTASFPVTVKESTRTDNKTISYTSLTTLCDGVPRAVFTKTPGTEVTQVTTVKTAYTYISKNSTLSYEGTPPCTVNPDPLSSYCKQFQEVYNSRITTWFQNPSAGIFELVNKFPKFCTTDTEPVAPAYGHLTKPECFLTISSAQLYYWHTEKPTNFCNWTATTNAPNPDGKPDTMVINGTTLTSPSVYVYVHGLNYWRRTMQSTTVLTKDTFLAFQPKEIRSVCGYRGGDGPYEMNYADFNEPIPWSAWACQPRCFGLDVSTCNPMGANIASDYKPQLSVPSNFSTVLADLGLPADCSLYGRGWPFTDWHDPPQMLKPADHLLEPKPTTAHATTANGPIVTHEPPSPSSAPPSPPAQTAVPTALPVENGDRSPPADPPSPGNTNPAAGSNEAGPDTGRPWQSPSNGNGASDSGNGGSSAGQGNDAATGNETPSRPQQPVVIIGGTATLTAGGPPTTISGHVISIPTQAPGPDSGSDNASPGSNSGSGSGASSGGHPASDSVVVIDSSTIPMRDLSNMIATAMPDLQSADVQVITPSSSGKQIPARPVPAIVVGGTTLVLGDAPITVGGKVISMITATPTAGGQSGGAAVVIDGSTIALSSLDSVLATGLSELRSAGMRATTITTSSKPGSTDAAVDSIAGWIVNALGGKVGSARPTVAAGSGQNGGVGGHDSVAPFTGDASRLGHQGLAGMFTFGTLASAVGLLALVL
ncbi:Hypothetical protein D9617_1g088240 [Elsinoe fawcettii]|nr:Hypothetical protein D9617_1g088240 [Elsinoe fawcettii]